MEKVIEVRDLRREYYTYRGFPRKKREIVHAVNGLSFNVNRGEIFGLLGQNGAGKTTTIKMLTTLLAPTSGICRVLGWDTFGQEKEIRQRINFIFGGETEYTDGSLQEIIFAILAISICWSGKNAKKELSAFWSWSIWQSVRMIWWRLIPKE